MKKKRWPFLVLRHWRIIQLKTRKEPTLARKAERFRFITVEKHARSFRPLITKLLVNNVIYSDIVRRCSECNLKSYDSKPNVSTFLSSFFIKGDLKCNMTPFILSLMRVHSYYWARGCVNSRQVKAAIIMVPVQRSVGGIHVPQALKQRRWFHRSTQLYG